MTRETLPLIIDDGGRALVVFRMTAKTRRSPRRLDRKRYTWRKARRQARMIREAARTLAIAD